MNCRANPKSGGASRTSKATLPRLKSGPYFPQGQDSKLKGAQTEDEKKASQIRKQGFMSRANEPHLTFANRLQVRWM
jgi:hypothetical protein